MITLNQAYKLLSLAEEVESSLKGLCITITKGDTFSVEEGFLEYHITIGSQDKTFKHDMVSWLRNHNDLKDHEVMFYEFEDVFSFFHEIGHILTSWTIENDQEYYNQFKNKVYISKYHAFKEYRNIPTERLADCKAMELIRNLLPELYMMFNGCSSKEKALEEISFWAS